MKKADITMKVQESVKVLPRKSATSPIMYHFITADIAGKA